MSVAIDPTTDDTSDLNKRQYDGEFADAREGSQAADPLSYETYACNTLSACFDP